ncbi:hypothetical protein NADFUDRAFT_45122 [Nadsonia fulvescens var. elongata DSM 6958]|uniref:Uncharacterized protein n=1 Tax=Nadsonia fulvescens var. elongata DSM 6958 TaxID=857566 RepID=A0A1E3PTM5_9ASCO|nr:hypothetical protein NADFUDRAFT_45122 [Nadsonia fulvescens var. elongata DSM 6958]
MDCNSFKSSLSAPRSTPTPTPTPSLVCLRPSIPHPSLNEYLLRVNMEKYSTNSLDSSSGGVESNISVPLYSSLPLTDARFTNSQLVMHKEGASR